MNIIIGRSMIIPLPGLPPGTPELKLVWIPSGAFTMGSPADEPDHVPEEEQQFEATISQGFWLGQYLVTQAQWQAVMGSNPSHFRQWGEDYPAENISWYDAFAFCHELNRTCAAQLPAAYEFRPPTEAEWEYACRAGTHTTYHSGNSLADLSRIAWHKENSDGHTHPVGQKVPNAWGLYDMHGNVAEWCYDATSDYPKTPTTDWVGTGEGSARSIRSAAYGTPPEDGGFRCASRGYVDPNVKRPWFGFRLCLSRVI